MFRLIPEWFKGYQIVMGELLGDEIFPCGELSNLFNFLLRKDGAPERIRTSDPQIRSLVLYPAELRVRACLPRLLRRWAVDNRTDC